MITALFKISLPTVATTVVLLLATVCEDSFPAPVSSLAPVRFEAGATRGMRGPVVIKEVLRGGCSSLPHTAVCSPARDDTLIQLFHKDGEADTRSSLDPVAPASPVPADAVDRRITLGVPPLAPGAPCLPHVG